MKKESIATVQMLMCAAMWSIAGIFMKLIPWNGFAIAGIRSLIAGTTMLVYMRIAHLKLVINRQTLIAAVAASSVYICFTVANKMTTAANAIVLQFTAPVFIVVFTALIKKQRIAKRDMLVVIFTLIGIALFFFDQLQPGYILGNCVAILAGIFMAGMFMTSGELKGQDRISGIFLGQMLTFLVGLPFIILTRPELTATAVSSVLILGVVQLGLSYILYVKAAEYCPPLACCLLGALEPLLNPVWVFLFDGERPGLFALIGAVIVVASITVWCVKTREPESV